MKNKMNKNVGDVRTQLIDELLANTDPLQILGKDGLFQDLKKQIINSRHSKSSEISL